VPDDLLTIGELARRTARRPSSIRYYEEIGVLPEPVRIDGRRRYPEETVRTLTVVDTAQRAGLTLEEIRALLTATPDDAAATEELCRIAERKLPELDATIERAVLVRRWLEAASRCECPSLDECCLFEPGAGPPAV
jgi:MerR family transcriptional regulator, redox-sensitive transcriptional activator SoxR